MQTIERRVVTSHQPGRSPLCGMLGYIDPDRPVLLIRKGWEVSNDIHDDFTDQISLDNGRTWSEPRLSLRSRKVDGGHLVYTENALLLEPRRRLVVTFTNEKFEGAIDKGCNLEDKCRPAIRVQSVEDAIAGRETPMFVSDFGLEQGLCVSFTTPVLDSRGRILVTLQWQQRDADGSLRKMGIAAQKTRPEVMTDYWQVGLLVGEFDGENKLSWKLKAPVPLAPGLSSRGMCEGTVAELAGGRLVMILRGSNHLWPDRPGYKWVSFSDDGGDSWTSAAPLAFDDGSFPESSATGSALFRSNTDNRLYWMGNLCADGERPRGNDPRSPLYIARMREQPFAIERDSLAIIDTRRAGDDPRVQHSNFKFYQDRETGDVVLHLTRYAERGMENNAWMLADQYAYRVKMD